VSERRARLEGAIRAELADLGANEIKDPRVHAAGLMTFTRVELTADLRSARAYVSFTGAPEAATQAVAALGRAVGFIRGELARRLSLRRAPELRFIHDRGAEHVARIDALLKNDGD
jgi:ribosome-binding factor A